MTLSSWDVATWAGFAVVVYWLALIVYRLYFHPLAAFPGPRLAAATFWYECFQDIFSGQGGEYTNLIDQIHCEYGGSQELLQLKVVSLVLTWQDQSFALHQRRST